MSGRKYSTWILSVVLPVAGIAACNAGGGHKPGEKLAVLDLRPDIDRPLQDLAVDPEPDIRLVARLDLAGQRHPLAALLHFDRDRPHRPDDRRRSLLLLVTSRKKENNS